MTIIPALAKQARLASLNPHFKAWFGDSKVVSGNGLPTPLFHGAPRPDRIGARFRRTRATAGPMAYFTDEPSQASGYALNKQDTSAALDDRSYASWFKVRMHGREFDLDAAWWQLPPDLRAHISDRLPDIRECEETDRIAYVKGQGHPAGTRATWERDYLRRASGNPLATAVNIWLEGGILFGEEERFFDVLREAGLSLPVRFDHPHATYPCVFPVWARIATPLVTSEIRESTLNALHRAISASRWRHPGYSADAWHKIATSPRDWMGQVLEDHAKGQSSTAWTTIPDVVTRTLVELGFDGVKDTGGGSSSNPRNVWVPFDPGQVKSAIGNSGWFSRENHSLVDPARKLAWEPAPIEPEPDAVEYEEFR